MMYVLIYNVLIAALDLAGLGLVSARPRLRRCAAVFAGHAAMAIVLAKAVQRGYFGFAQLLAWWLFLHGTLLVAGAAALLWKARRPWAIVLAAAGVGLVAAAIDGFLIEPTWLEVTHQTVSAPEIRRPLRIVVLADLQTEQIGEYERRVIRQAIDEEPDVILLIGDYVQAPQQWDDIRFEFRDLMGQFGARSPARVFALRGNVEPYHWPLLFNGLGVTVVEQTQTFSIGGICLTCLSLRDSRDRDLQLARPAAGEFHLVAGHCPDFALGEADADVLVAGHTHGGQIRLPLVGPLFINSRIPSRWAAGLTRLGSGALLMVSRGIGMERAEAPRIRLFCRPELLVIDLVPEGQ